VTTMLPCAVIIIVAAKTGKGAAVPRGLASLMAVARVGRVLGEHDAVTPVPGRRHSCQRLALTDCSGALARPVGSRSSS
jgi:hypothetical protein